MPVVKQKKAIMPKTAKAKASKAAGYKVAGFNCGICGHWFKSNPERLRHEESHTLGLKERQKFSCRRPDCNRKYVKEKARDKHEETHDQDGTLPKATQEAEQVGAMRTTRSQSRQLIESSSATREVTPFDDFDDSQVEEEEAQKRRFKQDDGNDSWDDDKEENYSVQCPVHTCFEQLRDGVELVQHMQSRHETERKNRIYTVPYYILKPHIPKFQFGSNIEDISRLQEALDDDENDDGGDAFEEEEDEYGYTPALLTYIGMRNDAFIKHYTSAYEGLDMKVRLDFAPRKCDGYGDNPCPFNTTRNPNNTFLRLATTNGGRDVRITDNRSCLLCHRLGSVATWHLYVKKHLETGLCFANHDCQEPATVGVLCQTHSDNLKLRRHKKTIGNIVSIRSLPAFKRKGPGSRITNAEQMRKHLDTRGLTLGLDDMKEFQNLSRVEEVFYVDVEFVGDTVLEICVLNSKGEVILNTYVDHGYTVAELYATQDHSACLFKLIGIYGPPSDKRTPGMTPQEVANVLLANGFNRKSHVVEWSLNYCDLRHLQAMFEKLGLSDMIPTSSIRPLIGWRRALPGFMSFKLSIVFSFVFPERRDLFLNAHLARPDTEMLFLRQ